MDENMAILKFDLLCDFVTNKFNDYIFVHF